MKDDNLGLGARNGGERAGECTGLNDFKDLLGRLNGENEQDIEERREKRKDAKIRVYVAGRWGGMRFVSGGWLIGDKIQGLIEEEKERIRMKRGEETEFVAKADGSESKKERKKRMRDVLMEEPQVESENKKLKRRKGNSREAQIASQGQIKVTKKEKKKKKKRNGFSDEAPHVSAEKSPLGDVKPARVGRRKDFGDQNRESPEVVAVKVKKSKDKKVKKRSKSDEKAPEQAANVIEADPDGVAHKATRRKDKKPRPLPETSICNHDAQKILSKKHPEAKEGPLVDVPDGAAQQHRQVLPINKLSTSSNTHSITSSARSTPIMAGRHAVRSRNIAQKRMACMDATALNQIFMIKGLV